MGPTVRAFAARSDKPTRGSWLAVLGAGVILGVPALWMLAQWGGQAFSANISYLDQAISAVAGLVFAAFASAGLRGARRAAWTCVTAVLALQAVGIGFDAIHGSILNLGPEHPSGSELAAFLSIPLLLCAAGLFLSTHPSRSRAQLAIDSVLLAGTVAFVAAVAQAAGLSGASIGQPLPLLCPAVELSFAALVTVLAWRVPQPDRPALRLLGAAMLLMAVGSTGSAYSVGEGSSPDRWFDGAMILSFALAGLAALQVRPTVSVLRESETMSPPNRMLVFSLVAIAVLVALVSEISGHTLSISLVWAGLGLVALAGAGQTVALRDNLALVAKLLQRADALESSEARYRSLVQNSSDAIVVLNETGVITYVSPVADQILGSPYNELMGARLFSFVHPDDRDALHAYLSATNTADHSWGDIHFRTRDASGQWRHLEATPTNLIDDANVNGIVLNTRDVTDRRALEEQLRHQAFHDPLTRLANRALLRDRVEHALARTRRDGGQIAVLFIDLDDFKDVNDTLGHAIGDKMLSVIADRLRSSLRLTDTAARLGGDEFAVLLDQDVSEEESIAVARRILECISAPMQLDDTHLGVRASVGIALGDSMQDPDDVLRRADVAMYQAKSAGKGDVAVFDSSMDLMVVARLQFEVDMQAALANGQLTAHYQPIVNLDTGAIEGAEALVRWQHPTRGLLPPSEFVGLAEETGQIVILGRQMLLVACTEAKRWHTEMGSNAYVSVNVSSKHFQSRTLIEDVNDALNHSGLEPERLVIEVTESALLANVHESKREMDALRKMGIRIALDDFGTGYSSLGYLRELPVDVLKIDRSFVTDLGTGQQPTDFIRAIQTLSKSLALLTIAEGVEEENQLALLHDLDIHLAQGYWFSRPVAGPELLKLLAAGNFPIPALKALRAGSSPR